MAECVQGYNISIGRGSYLNFDCCFLDVCPIKIGDNVMFGPHVQVSLMLCRAVFLMI